MSELGIDGASDNFAAVVSEALGSIRESNDFSWAHESEIEWPEEKDYVLSFVVRQLELLELEFVVCSSLNLWGWVSDGYLRDVGQRESL